MTRQAADAWGMLMGEADRLVEVELEKAAKAKLCPHCLRKATPRGGWCVPCADERRRKYNTEFVRAARNARKPKLDRMDMKAIELFRREGWDEDERWQRLG